MPCDAIYNGNTVPKKRKREMVKLNGYTVRHSFFTTYILADTEKTNNFKCDDTNSWSKSKVKRNNPVNFDTNSHGLNSEVVPAPKKRKRGAK